MNDIDKASLSGGDICTKCSTPAIKDAEWGVHAQVREDSR